MAQSQRIRKMEVEKLLTKSEPTNADLMKVIAELFHDLHSNGKAIDLLNTNMASITNTQQEHCKKIKNIECSIKFLKNEVKPIQEHSSCLSQVSANQIELESKIQNLAKTFENLNIEFAKAKKEIADCSISVETRSENDTIIHKLNREMNIIKQSKFDNDVVVLGINNSGIQCSDLIQKLNTVYNFDSDIINAFKIEQKRNRSKANLIIQFASHDSKIKFLSRKRELGPLFNEQIEETAMRFKIIINDRMTNEYIKILSNLTVKLKAKKISKFWYRNGLIYILRNNGDIQSIATLLEAQLLER